MLLVFACVTAFLLAPAASQSMVKVGFYGEALCPDCIAFINGPLTIAFREVCWCALIRNQEFLYLYILCLYHTVCCILYIILIVQVPSIFRLHYAPWGNAKIVDDKFECQHGEMECTMNTVQACALNYYPNMYVYWYTNNSIAVYDIHIHVPCYVCVSERLRFNTILNETKNLLQHHILAFPVVSG